MILFILIFGNYNIHILLLFNYIFEKKFRFNNFQIIIKFEIIKLQKYLNVLNDNNFLELSKYSAILLKYWNTKFLYNWIYIILKY
jgi:hypothetical protein